MHFKTQNNGHHAADNTSQVLKISQVADWVRSWRFSENVSLCKKQAGS